MTVIISRGAWSTAAHARYKVLSGERIFSVSILDALSSPYPVAHSMWSELSLTLLQGRFPILIPGSSIQLWRWQVADREVHRQSQTHRDTGATHSSAVDKVRITCVYHVDPFAYQGYIYSKLNLGLGFRSIYLWNFDPNQLCTISYQQILKRARTHGNIILGFVLAV